MWFLHIFVVGMRTKHVRTWWFPEFPWWCIPGLTFDDSLDRRWPQKSMMPSGKRKRRTGPWKHGLLGHRRGSGLIPKYWYISWDVQLFWKKFHEKCLLVGPQAGSFQISEGMIWLEFSEWSPCVSDWRKAFFTSTMACWSLPKCMEAHVLFVWLMSWPPLSCHDRDLS